MRRVVAYFWLCLVLVVAGSTTLAGSGCSLVVDFPPELIDTDDGGGQTMSEDAGRDARVVERDAGRDAGRADAQQVDAAPATCKVDQLASCGDDKLCCDRQDNKGPVCVAVSSTGDCSECNVGCKEANAPNCGNRKCECEPGSGRGCVTNETCTGTGNDARCVQCTVDVDCKSRTDGRNQCVNNQCKECDRGAKAADSGDDEGCKPNAPICSTSNTCVGCSADNKCPDGLQCTPGVGCFGCTLVSNVPCQGNTPICKMAAMGPQCTACVNNSDCGSRYCAKVTGACVDACDPDEGPGNNGCTTDVSLPYCKASGGDFSCQGCAASDCSGTKPFCASAGQPKGQCVQCRTSADCDQNGLAPVCGVAGTCRERVAADCTGTPKPKLVAGQCVECVLASDCTGNPRGAVCAPGNVCGQCLSDLNCAAPRPACNIATSTCMAGCTQDTQCAATPATPLCVMGMCAACTTLSGDNRCLSNYATKKFCARAGTLVGQCTACEPSVQAGCDSSFCAPATAACVECDPVTNTGCADTPTTAFCVAGVGAAAPRCRACDPAKPTSCVTGTCSPTTFTCSTGGATDAGTDGG
ncbi:MAG: hypothetical protein RLZZ450_3166 [Pseudomonadota bacterium]